MTELKPDSSYKKIFNLSLVFEQRGVPGQSLWDNDLARGHVDSQFEIKDVTIVYSEMPVR